VKVREITFEAESSIDATFDCEVVMGGVFNHCACCSMCHFIEAPAMRLCKTQIDMMSPSPQYATSFTSLIKPGYSL
jgi:hypothetical protein